MNLCNINHSFNYELEKLCRIFLPHDKINILNEVSSDSVYAVCSLSKDGKRAVAELFADGKEAREERECEGDEKSAELALATCLYECFCRLLYLF